MILHKIQLSFLLPLILLFATEIYAQHPVSDAHYPDSLLNIYQSAAADTTKANALFLLSDYWSVRDTTKALQYIRESYDLAKSDPFYTSLYHFYLAGIYFEFDTDRSQQEYMKADTLFSAFHTPQAYLFRSRSWNNFGVLEQMNDKDEQYIDILLNKAIPFAAKSGNTTYEAVNNMNVGLVFMNYQDYEKALTYYQRAIKLFQQTDTHYSELADCYTNMAKTYIFNNQYKEAKPCLDSAAQILAPNPESSYFPAYYQVEGMYYSRIELWKEANKSFEKGANLASQLNRPYDVISILFQQYKSLNDQKKYQQAREVLLKVYNEQKILPLTKNKRMVLYELAQTDANLGDMASAYQWLQQFAEVSDSFYVEETEAQIAALETKYQTAQKEKEILTLQNKSKEQELVLARNVVFNYLLFGGLLLLLLLLIILYLLYRNKQRKIIEQTAAHEQKVKEMEKEEQLKVYNAMLEGQELERNRIARDLHDGLGGMLAGVKLKLSSVTENEGHQQSDAELGKVVNLLDLSVTELRRIARNMMPETLLKFGLEPALQDLCNSMESSQIRIVFQAYGLKEQMEKNTQITIYRIIQELISNAIRHADASQIIVQCSQNEDIFFITVEDDGKGFDQQQIKNKTGLGLFNIQNRVNYLKGKIEMQSTLGEGTTVNIEVVVNNE